MFNKFKCELQSFTAYAVVFLEDESGIVLPEWLGMTTVYVVGVIATIAALVTIISTKMTGIGTTIEGW